MSGVAHRGREPILADAGSWSAPRGVGKGGCGRRSGRGGRRLTGVRTRGGAPRERLFVHFERSRFHRPGARQATRGSRPRRRTGRGEPLACMRTTSRSLALECRAPKVGESALGAAGGQGVPQAPLFDLGKGARPRTTDTLRKEAWVRGDPARLRPPAVRGRRGLRQSGIHGPESRPRCRTRSPKSVPDRPARAAGRGESGPPAPGPLLRGVYSPASASEGSSTKVPHSRSGSPEALPPPPAGGAGTSSGGMPP